MVEDSVSSSSSDEFSAIHESLDKWSNEGQDILNRLFTDLYESDVIVDPTMKILLYSVIGSYTNRLSTTWRETGDLQLAHTQALNQVMSNPAVENLVDGAMGGMISKSVEELI